MIFMCEANKKFIVTIRCIWALFYYLYFLAREIEIESLSNMSKVTQVVSGELRYKVRSA